MGSQYRYRIRYYNLLLWDWISKKKVWKSQSTYYLYTIILNSHLLPFSDFSVREPGREVDFFKSQLSHDHILSWLCSNWSALFNTRTHSSSLSPHEWVSGKPSLSGNNSEPFLQGNSACALQIMTYYETLILIYTCNFLESRATRDTGSSRSCVPRGCPSLLPQHQGSNACRLLLDRNVI
jgi:hypothetical protein